MSNERYSELFNEGYEAYYHGGDPSPELTHEEREAWTEGYEVAWANEEKR